VDDEFETTLKEGVDAQKKMMQRIFADAGWEAPRILEGMEEADDFYMQKVAQLRMDQWSKGRTVLVGDSGYCPSPISGMGTTVALVGAYVLAGEITKSPRDHETAFRNYEEKMRGFVTTAQKLAPGAPAMANPQTQLGIYMLYKFLGFVSWSGLNKLMGSSVNPPASAMDLPDYEL
jgi:2-polyprenyl-6-methoxyphenol hydroxylase-like FAD-dependent oxidoreductase